MPPKEPANGRTVALVIGAGSVKCAAALGLQKSLNRAGISIDMVVGCSGGSLYAAQIALGTDADESERMTYALWTRELTRKRSTSALLKTIAPHIFGFDQNFGLIDDTLIVNRLKAAYGEQSFADTRIPLYIVATDFETGEKVILEEGYLRDAIRASIAIPFIFKPWRMGNRLLMDGFMSDPLPVDVAIKEGANLIIALGFDSPYQTRIDSAPRFAFQVTTIMANHLLTSNFAFHNLAHHTEVIPIVPEFERRIRAFDTDELHYIIEQGEKAMSEQIPYLQQLLQVE
jgi:NTE family protein